MPNLTWLYAGAIYAAAVALRRRAAPPPPRPPRPPRRPPPAETHRVLFLRARPALLSRAADHRHDQRTRRLLRVAAAVGECDQASASEQSLRQRRRAAAGAVGACGARALACVRAAA